MNMSTNDSSISLELIPRIPNDGKIQVANNDIIRFYATAHTKNIVGRRLHYAWKVYSSTAYSEGNKVAVSLPNRYCGEWVTLYVDVEKKTYKWYARIANAIKDIFSEDIEETKLEIVNKTHAHISFYPWCPPLVNQIEWCDIYYQPQYKYRDLYLNDIGYIVLDIEGVNGRYLHGDILINGQPVEECIPTLVSNNYACFFFLISSDWVEQMEPGSEVTIEFRLMDEDIKKPNGERYTTTKKLHIEKRRNKLNFNPSNQPLVTGELAVVENNFEKCKYTQIKAKLIYDDNGRKELSGYVFDENLNYLPKTIEIVGCDNFNTHLHLELINYSTDGCGLAETDKHKHREGVLSPKFSIKNNLNNNLYQEKAIIDTSSGKVDIDVNYTYDRYKLLALLIPLGPAVQEHTLKLATCRHMKDLKILMYPDIEWEFYFTYNSTIGKQKLLGMGFEVNDLHTDEFDPKCTIDVEHKFSVNLKGSYNKGSETIILGKEISEIIKVTLDVFAMIKYLIVSAFHLENTPISDNPSGAEEIKNVSLTDRPHKALSVYICTPEIALGVKWKMIQKEIGKTNLELRFFANLDPLLVVGIIIDVISLASRSGPWGTIVATIRNVMEAYDQKINLFILATASSKVISELVVINRDETSEEDQDIFKFRAEGELKVLFELDVQGKFIGIQLQFKTEAYGKGGLFCDLYFGIDDNGIYYTVGYGNTSCEIAAKIKGSILTNTTHKRRGSIVKQDSKKEEVSFVELEHKIELIPEKTWGDNMTNNKKKKNKHYIKVK